MTTHYFFRLSLAVLCVFASAELALAVTIDPPVRTVALAGQSAPGGGQFSEVFTPVLNRFGQAAFYATAGSQGIWSEGTGTLSKVAKIGDAAPGITNATFSTFTVNLFSTLKINDLGQTAFAAQVTGPGIVGTPSANSNSRGVWSGTTNGLSLMAREGETITDGASPGTLSFNRFVFPALNNSGSVSLIGAMFDFTPGLTTDTLLIRPSTGNGLVARTSMQAVGMSVNVFYGSFITGLSSQALLNDNGQTAFNASTTFFPGIWKGSANNLSLVAGSRQAAPGMPAGWQFFSLSDPSINNDGHTVFYSILQLNGNQFVPNNHSVWSDRSGTPSLVAREGDAAPGLSSVLLGPMWQSTSWQAPLINQKGNIAFATTLTGSGVTTANDSAIFSDGFGAMAPVAREGDVAPGSASGVFGDLSNISYSINGNGQVAFIAPVSGLTGIYAQDITGTLRLIAQVGDSLQVAPGDIRTITGLRFVAGSGGADGRQSGFSDNGEVGFYASFGGSTGAFVSNAVLVPEPSAFMLSAASLAIFLIGFRFNKR